MGSGGEAQGCLLRSQARPLGPWEPGGCWLESDRLGSASEGGRALAARRAHNGSKAGEDACECCPSPPLLPSPPPPRSLSPEKPALRERRALRASGTQRREGVVLRWGELQPPSSQCILGAWVGQGGWQP